MNTTVHHSPDSNRLPPSLTHSFTFNTTVPDSPYFLPHSLTHYEHDSPSISSLTVPHSVRNEDISEAHMFLMRPTEEGQAAYDQLERSFSTLNFEVGADHLLATVWLLFVYLMYLHCLSTVCY